MRPAFRYASAAAILLIVFVWLPRPSHSPALADVIKAAEQHSLVRFQARQTTDDRETRQTASGKRTVYVDIRMPRVREEERSKTFNDILDFSYTAVYDYRRDRFLALVTHEQVITRDQAKDEHETQLIRMVEEAVREKGSHPLPHRVDEDGRHPTDEPSRQESRLPRHTSGASSQHEHAYYAGRP